MCTATPSTVRVNDHVPSTYTLGWEQRLRRLHISNYLAGFL